MGAIGYVIKLSEPSQPLRHDSVHLIRKLLGVCVPGADTLLSTVHIPVNNILVGGA